MLVQFAMLVLLLFVALLVCIVLLICVSYYKCSKAEIPPGVCIPKSLWRIHMLSTAVFLLGKVFEKFGVCSEIGFIRFISRFFVKSNLPEDPELLMKNVEFDGVPVRVYQPRAPSAGGRKGIMFFHGGGFMAGSIDQYDSLCRYLSKNSEAVVVSVGYRLAPEHRYPAAFDDCLNAAAHFLKTAQDHGVDESSVILSGDSAGGNLTAGVCQALVIRKDLPKPLAQVMIYPVVQLVDYNLPSYQQYSNVPPSLRDNTVFYKLNYLGVDPYDDLRKDILDGSFVPPQMRQKFSKWLSADNIPDEFKANGYKPHTAASFNQVSYEKIRRVFEPSLSPLLAEDAVMGCLPQAYILTCQCDVLRDDGILYKKRLEDNGVPVTWYHVEDGFHGIINFFDKPDYASGKLALGNIVTFIKSL